MNTLSSKKVMLVAVLAVVFHTGFALAQGGYSYDFTDTSGGVSYDLNSQYVNNAGYSYDFTSSQTSQNSGGYSYDFSGNTAGGSTAGGYSYDFTSQPSYSNYSSGYSYDFTDNSSPVVGGYSYDFSSQPTVGGYSYDFTTPVVTNSSYTPYNYGNTNYGTVDYGYSNYGNVDYGYTGGSSWTGVVVTGGYNGGGTSCPSGSSWVNGTCQINTITCPNGTHRVNNTCVVDTTTCPAGSTLVNGTCQVNTTTCPAGSSLVNGVCQVNQTNCPAGTHRVNNACVVDTTTCPAGSTLVNGTCQINTTTCPTGSTLINGVCQAPITCPAGTTYQNGTCVGQGTTVCPAGSTLVNGVCQINTTSCPAGSYLQNGICVIQNTVTTYTCPNGQVVSNLYACPVTYGQTSYSYTTIPIVYQTCWDGTTIPNTSVCPSQYKVCANGTSIPVYQQCYVAQLPVYVPPPVIKFNNVVTSPTTQITNVSARCNGIGLIAQNAQSTGWFEYGQTTNLGRSTAQAIIGSAPTSPFSNVLTNLQPSTDYYCRAVMQNQYGLVKGEIVKFTTKGRVATYVQPAPKKTTTVTKTTTKKNQITCSDGSIVSVGSQTSATMLNDGQKLIAVQLEKVTGDLQVGGNATYRMTYKNLADATLSGVEIKIVVPQEITVTNVPVGGYDVSTHTITFSQLTINPYSQNVIEWSGTVAKNAPVGKTVVTTAYLLYTVPGTNVQDEVTAYTASSIMQPTDVGTLSGAKNVIGTGHSFLPESLVEWLALIAILFILFILGRSIANSYKKGDESHH